MAPWIFMYYIVLVVSIYTVCWSSQYSRFSIFHSTMRIKMGSMSVKLVSLEQMGTLPSSGSADSLLCVTDAFPNNAET